MNNKIGSPKSKARYESIKYICVDCIKELRKEYKDNSFYENPKIGFCECCETENKKIVERF